MTQGWCGRTAPNGARSENKTKKVAIYYYYYYYYYYCYLFNRH